MGEVDSSASAKAFTSWSLRAHPLSSTQQMAMAQQQAMLELQARIVAMQEQTKRAGDQLDALEKQRDRLAKLTVEMTKIEADTGRDVPFGLLDGDESGEVIQ